MLVALVLGEAAASCAEEICDLAADRAVAHVAKDALQAPSEAQRQSTTAQTSQKITFDKGSIQVAAQNAMLQSQYEEMLAAQCPQL